MALCEFTMECDESLLAPTRNKTCERDNRIYSMRPMENALCLHMSVASTIGRSSSFKSAIFKIRALVSSNS